MGLYGGLKAQDIKERKGLKKSQNILGHLRYEELAANLFRATQTEAKLRREHIQGKEKANQTHFEVGKEVRDTISRLGGTMPLKRYNMNARKSSSGSWLARLFLGTDADGKKHYKSFTAPTKREAERLALNYVEEHAKPENITFGDALAQYIESKSNILSPSTLRGYRQMMVYLSEIDQNTVIRFVNDFAGKHSPKTVRNAYSLLCAVIRSQIPNASFDVAMPQKKVLQYYIPEDKELKKLLAYTKASDYDLYIAILLASVGTLRRSEVCGLYADDIKDNTVHVHQVMVKDQHFEWVMKPVPKNSSSDRYVEYPKHVIAAIPKSGKICNLNPDQITHHFGDVINKLQLPHLYMTI